MSTPRATQAGDRARVFKALGHPVRLQIVEALEQDGEACVCHLEHRLGLRQAYLSQHLAKLRVAGVVTDRRRGANVFYAVSDEWVSSLLGLVPTTTTSAKHHPAGRRRRAHGACPCPRCNDRPAEAATPSPFQGEGRVGVDHQSDGQHRREETR